MKATRYIAFIIMGIFIILSLPILSILWSLGGNKPFKNIGDFASKTIFEDIDNKA